MKNLFKFYKKLNKYWKVFSSKSKSIFTTLYAYIKRYKYVSLFFLVAIILFSGYVYNKKDDKLDLK